MLTVTVEGIYESDIGSGQKKYENFSYKIETSREDEIGINTHIMRRFIPYFVYKDKSKKGIIFSRLKNYYITNIEKSNSENKLIGKDINSLNELEIQDLACMFDLYEIPLPLTCSLTELREKAILAYMKKVLKIPMNNDKEKSELDFLRKCSDGSWKLDLKDEKVIVEIPNGYFENESINSKKEIRKKGLSFFQKAGQAVANTILTVTGNSNEQNNPQNANQANTDIFPNANDLLSNNL